MMAEVAFGAQLPLPSGGWFVLRPPGLVSERLRKPIKRAVASVSQDGLVAQNTLATLHRLRQDQTDWAASNPGQSLPTAMEIPADLRSYRPVGFSGQDIDAFDLASDLLVVALVEAWSFPEPVTLDSVVDRVGPDYDLLRETCASLMAELFPNFSATQDQASPTAPSDGSETSSEGLPVSANPTSRTSGEPTGSSSSAST